MFCIVHIISIQLARIQQHRNLAYFLLCYNSVCSLPNYGLCCFNSQWPNSGKNFNLLSIMLYCKFLGFLSVLLQYLCFIINLFNTKYCAMSLFYCWQICLTTALPASVYYYCGTYTTMLLVNIKNVTYL